MVAQAHAPYIGAWAPYSALGVCQYMYAHAMHWVSPWNFS
jgi:hypothetical protein